MSCGPVPVLYRILDASSEWQLDVTGDSSTTVGDVIELAQLDPLQVDPGSLDGVMPPPWLARGCGSCSWFVASPARCGTASVLSMLCGQWVPIAGIGCRIALVDPIAVTAASDRVAILDGGQILIVTLDGDRVIASWPTAARGPIAFVGNTLVVANGAELVAYDLVTLDARALATAPGPVARLIDAAGTLWAAITRDAGIELFRLVAGAWQAGTLAELAATARPTAIASSGDNTFCLDIPEGDAAPRRACFDRCGKSGSPPAATVAPRRATSGTATATLIDSGIPRCRWHRLRIDLAFPEHTGLEIALVSVEDPTTAPSDLDWQVIDAARVMVAGSTIVDALVAQPPGRYLSLRLSLRGDGFATPSIRRIRLDMPRSTSAERLPGVYREDPIATDFLDRFVASFDASIEDLDRAIERFPALIDADGTPAEALAWLGTFLDIALDPSWSEATRRSILAEAPALYRRRGTPWALARAIQLVTGVVPAIQELGAANPFARLSAFRVGDNRLFGRARARVRLGSSALGSAPLRSYGDPDRDHVAAVAWRIVVQVPSGAASGDAATRLRQLVDTQKPAHIAATVRVGSDIALLGVTSAVGIDTRLSGLPLPYLHINTQLRRRTVLAPGTRRGGSTIAVGVSAAIGIQTVLS